MVIISKLRDKKLSMVLFAFMHYWLLSPLRVLFFIGVVEELGPVKVFLL
jgi:hypothetical protein